MTREEFQSDPALRTQLRACLESPAFIAAVGVITDDFLGVDVADTSPEVASVRALSRRSGCEWGFAMLHRLSELPPEPPKEPLPDWGSGLSQEQLAQAELPPAFKAT